MNQHKKAICLHCQVVTMGNVLPHIAEKLSVMAQMFGNIVPVYVLCPFAVLRKIFVYLTI